MVDDIFCETHITLAATNSATLDGLRDWSESQSLKWTHIVLDRGETPSQPMVTFLGRGSVETQLSRADELAEEIGRLGGDVVRVKVETSANAPEITAEHRPDQYFEQHVKLLLEADCEIEDLRQLAIAHDAHLSRNARRHRADGRTERFVTQRVYGGTTHEASEQLGRLLAALNRSSWQVLEVESEYVLHDSNRAVDDGWL